MFPLPHVAYKVLDGLTGQKVGTMLVRSDRVYRMKITDITRNDHNEDFTGKATLTVSYPRRIVKDVEGAVTIAGLAFPYRPTFAYFLDFVPDVGSSDNYFSAILDTRNNAYYLDENGQVSRNVYYGPSHTDWEIRGVVPQEHHVAIAWDECRNAFDSELIALIALNIPRLH